MHLFASCHENAEYSVHFSSTFAYIYNIHDAIISHIFRGGFRARAPHLIIPMRQNIPNRLPLSLCPRTDYTTAITKTNILFNQLIDDVYSYDFQGWEKIMLFNSGDPVTVVVSMVKVEEGSTRINCHHNGIIIDVN